MTMMALVVASLGAIFYLLSELISVVRFDWGYSIKLYSGFSALTDGNLFDRVGRGLVFPGAFAMLALIAVLLLVSMASRRP